MPRKTSLNWFIPAFVKSNVGSFAGSKGLERTRVWPLRSKYSRNFSRISGPVINSEGRSQKMKLLLVQACSPKLTTYRSLLPRSLLTVHGQLLNTHYPLLTDLSTRAQSRRNG